MTLMRESVTTFDLRDTSVVATLRDSSLPLVLAAAGAPTVENPGTGVVRPFNIVIIDDAHRLEEHAEVYRKLGEPSLTLRTMVVVSAREDSTIKGLVLPSVLDSPAVTLLWVSNPAGISWVPGTPMAEGFGAWPNDPGGAAAFDSLIDTLLIPEVFDRAFSTMAVASSPIHTVGLRRWVFRLDSGQSIDDFVYEAGARIAGDRGIDPSREEPRFWTLPPELTGDAESDSVFVPVEGSVVDLLDKAERRVGALHRLGSEDDAAIVANSEEELIESAVACGQAFDELVDTGVRLVKAVDATDGIDESEHAAVKRLGVNLHPGYEAPPLLDVSDDMLESVVWDLEEGHSLEPLLARMAADAETVRIPSQSDRVKELNAFKGSKARKHLEDGEDSFPLSVWSRLMGTDWRAIDWRIGAVVGAALALVAAVLMFVQNRITTEEGFNTVCMWNPACDVSRAVFDWRGWFFILGGVALAAVVAIPLLIIGIRRMARLVRGWIDELGSRRIVADARKYRQRVASIVLNDWVLGGYRSQAADMLSTARESLEAISEVVAGRMIDIDADVETEVATQKVNPQIEQSLNVAGGAVLYRAFSPIVELIRLDIIDLITRTVRSFWPRLQARSGAQLPAQVAAAVDHEIQTYLTSLSSETLLDPALGDSESEHRRRRALEKLWQDRDLVAGTVRYTVEAGPESEMLQMVGLGDLPVLDSSSNASAFIRFVPSLAGNEVRALQMQAKGSGDVLLTEHLTTVGVLRVVPIRDGVVSFLSSVEDVDVRS